MEKKVDISKILYDSWQNFVRHYCEITPMTDDQKIALCEMYGLNYNEEMFKLLEAIEENNQTRFKEWKENFLNSLIYPGKIWWYDLPDDLTISTIINAQRIVNTEKNLMETIENNPGCKKAWNDILIQLRLGSPVKG